MGQVFSLEHEIKPSDIPTKAIMMLKYENKKFHPISFLDFVKAPADFTSHPVIAYEPYDGVCPKCDPELRDRVAHTDTVRAVQQSFRITPYQCKGFRMWTIMSQTISQSQIKEVLDAMRTFKFSDFQSTRALEASSIFYDLKSISSLNAALRPPSAGMRCSSPARCGLGSLTSAGPLIARRSQQATSLQTTFSMLDAPKTPSARSNDCDKIVDRLYIGGESAAANTSRLKTLGITHIVNLNGQISTEAEFCRGFTCFAVKMRDSEFEELPAEFWDAVQFVREALLTGGCVLVHCRRGISRSAALCVAYLMESQMISFDAALHMVTQQRPVVKINPGFEEQLRAREVKPRPLSMKGKKLLLNLVVK